MLERVAKCISPSAAHSQGPEKTVEKAQRFLRRPSLIAKFSEASSAEEFRATLDRNTAALRKALPEGTNKKTGKPWGKHWGSARKFMNIFLFECVLNKRLYKHYKLAKLEPWLEVPLDNSVAKGIRKDVRKHKVECKSGLPQFRAITHLTKDDSNAFQCAASELAKTFYRCDRVYLDLQYFRQGDSKKRSQAEKAAK